MTEILNTYKMIEICIGNLRQDFADNQKFNKQFTGSFYPEIILKSEYHNFFFSIILPHIQRYSIMADNVNIYILVLLSNN